MSVYLWAAILYLAVVEILRRIVNAIEHRLTRHMRLIMPRTDQSVAVGA
jgi:polar amino acid transport system permease protein